jgi:UDP-glucose 4-epimerase
MKKYIVTGGEGFIGSKIVAKIDADSFDLKSGQNILNKEQFRRACLSTKGIFHAAAKISVPESIEKPDEYYLNNVQGTQSVADVANENKLKIVFSSSAAVYGDSSVKVAENSALQPKSPYAQNKIDGEEILKKSKIPSVALRYFNVYGPGQSDAYAGVITIFIKQALQDKDILIYGDGNQVRDFIFVSDVVEANITAMNYAEKAFEIFNIGSGVETTIKELAEKIIFLTKSSSKIRYAPARKGDIVYSVADVSKVKNILGWAAKVSLGQGLKQVIECYRR